MSSKKRKSSLLKELLTFRVAPSDNVGSIRSFFESLDCPRSLSCWMLFSNGEHRQLAELECDPNWYDSCARFSDAYAATKFLSKYGDLSTGLDLDAVALEKFNKFESLCRSTNDRFCDLSKDPLFKGPTVWLHNAVKRKIETILGDISSEDFFSDANWGPGATTLLKRRDASATNKFQCETGITRSLYTFLHSDLGSLLKEYYPLWARHLESGNYPTFQKGNKVITVAKDATTNRVIAVEPGLNLWFQKSLGESIGKRLLRCGIDLRYQSRNQELARLGSKFSHLATADFSSASDSIAVQVIRELLPPRWFAALDLCRSHIGQQGEKQIVWEKFSSMGNGFTFQLESLVFFAVASCCVEYIQRQDGFRHPNDTVSVYGDDVVLPIRCLELFSEMSTFYGFKLNMKKSHFSSLFRESCGAYFYSGICVKPIFLKKGLSSVLTVYRLANAIRRLAHRRIQSLGCDEKFRVVFYRLVKLVPSRCRLGISEGLGDGGFVMNFDEACPTRAGRGFEGFRVMHVAEVSKTYKEDRTGLLLARLWSLQMKSPGTIPVVECRTIAKDRAYLKRDLLSYVSAIENATKTSHNNDVDRPTQTLIAIRKKTIVAQWYNFGPWI